jgi:hypothetical protein
VLVIPGQLVDFDAKKSSISPRWFTLQETVFSNQDQCLEIHDPIEEILDLLQEEGEEPHDLSYLFRRLPVDLGEDPDEGARQLLHRSLAAYHAERRDTSDEFERRIESLLLRRRADVKLEDKVSWRDQLAAESGVLPEVITALDESVHESDSALPLTVEGWVDWFFEWVGQEPRRLRQLVRAHTLEEVLNTSFGGGPGLSASDTVDAVHDLTWRWMSGESLAGLQSEIDTLNGSDRRLGTCDRARKLAIRLMPEVSYAIGLVALVCRTHVEHEVGGEGQMPLALACIAGCVREGHCSPEHLAIRYSLGPFVSRVACHRAHEAIAGDWRPGDPYESFARVRRRVRRAMRAAGLA